MLEVALYKVTTSVLMNNPAMSKIIRKYNADIIEVNSTYSVVEKTGKTEDIMALNKELSKEGGLLQFVSSGRIAITRAKIEHVNEYLEKIREKYEY